MASIISAGTTTATALNMSADTSGVLQLASNNGTVAVTIDGSQNLGVGVTPSAWGNTFKALDISTYAAVGGTTASSLLSANIYNDNTNWKYKQTAAASVYYQSGGIHQWYNAPSGTAGATATLTQAMTLDASGNLGIGTTSPSFKLDVRSSTASIAMGLVTTASGASASTYYSATRAWYVGVDVARTNGQLSFYDNTAGAERAAIDSSGNFLINATSGTTHKIYKATSSTILTITSNTGADSIYINGVNATGANLGQSAALYVQKDSGSGRSINTAGTVNASGADYAEYMIKAGDFTISKGDVAGINAEGKLTNVFADAVSFVVKSTDPSYVGGDSWGSEEALGLSKPNEDATQEEKDVFEAAVETARQRVDRIAFCGQVPVNVMGAVAGQYIVPVNDNGAIKGEAVSNPTFEQYQQAVGKVIAIEQDGRARIIVKVA
jgi:hypothetical protein